MSELYTNGFVNIDGGVVYGLMLDDSDYFLCLDIRKFKDTDFKKRGDELVKFLSKRLKIDLDTRHFDKEKQEYVPDFKDLTDEERKLRKEEMEKIICKYFGLVKA